ncbi:hypothetical protein L3Q82_000039 [Scortum barcoo]|uniref:Uncharacterized protein n=1 Tax=Scortum barcoo TaxID=214431 RepID=A0ACB8XB74_9TELE|nr:hypothetical protein L3Q82_000039 [Scortum barcoo]
MDSKILCNFYRCTIESILTGCCITAWYIQQLHLSLNSTVRLYREGGESCSAHHQDGAAIHGGSLHPAVYRKKATKIIKDLGPHLIVLDVDTEQKKVYDRRSDQVQALLSIYAEEDLHGSLDHGGDADNNGLQEDFYFMKKIKKGMKVQGCIGLVMSVAWFPPNTTPGINAKEFNLDSGVASVWPLYHTYRPDWWIAAEMVVLLEGSPLSTELLQLPAVVCVTSGLGAFGPDEELSGSVRSSNSWRRRSERNNSRPPWSLERIDISDTRRDMKICVQASLECRASGERRVEGRTGGVERRD